MRVLFVLLIFSLSSAFKLCAGSEPGSVWHQQMPKNKHADFTSISTFEGGYIATRDEYNYDKIEISSDGGTWKTVHRGASANDVVKGDFGFVSVGDAGVVLHSSHGYSWSSVGSITSENLKSVIWSGEAYIAVGSGGVIMRSSNGADWAQYSPSGVTSLNDLFMSHSQVLVIGDDGVVLKSSDHGQTWTQIDSGFNYDMRLGAEAPGGSLIVADDNNIRRMLYWRSDNTWDSVTTSVLYGKISGISSANGVLLAVTDRAAMHVSKDGDTWSKLNDTAPSGEVHVTHTSSGWLLVGELGEVVEFVPGVGWADADFDSSGVKSFHAVVEGHGKYYAFGHYNQVYSSVDGSFWKTVRGGSSSSQIIRSAVYAQNKVIAVGRFGTICSIDAQELVQFTSLGVSHSLRGVTANESLYVAVGEDGVIFSSLDGVTWASQISPTVSDLYAVEYGSDRFIAVGKDGVIVTSVDGMNWQLVEGAEISDDLMGVRWTSYGFVAVGNSGVISLSETGESWNIRESGTNQRLNAVVETDAGLLALGGNECVLVSGDAQEWDRLPNSSGGMNNDWFDALFSNSKLIAAGGRGLSEGNINFSFTAGVIQVSEFSFSSIVKSMPAASLNGVEVTDSGFMVVGERGLIQQSSNGIDWVKSEYSTNWDFHDVLSVGSQVVLAGSDGVLSSTDGGDWEVGRLSPDSNYLSDISPRRLAWGGGRWIACGSRGTILISDDGLVWRAPEDSSGALATSTAYVYSDVCWGAGLFVACGGNGGLFTSIDGETWNVVETNTSRTIQSVVWTGAFFLAGPISSGGGFLKSADGESWQQLAGLTTTWSMNRLNAVDGQVFALSPSEKILTTVDGNAWRYNSIGHYDTLKSIPRDYEYNDVAYRDGVYVAVGSDGLLARSVDGDQWEYQNGGYAHDLKKIYHARGRFIVLGEESAILSSSDGLLWTKHRAANFSRDRLQAFADNGSRAVIVGARVLFSDDLITWEELPSSPNAYLKSVDWDGTVFVAGGSAGEVFTSEDGVIWVERTGVNGSVQDICGVDSLSLILTDRGLFVSEDGVEWSEQAMEYRTDLYSEIFWDGGQFILSGPNWGCLLSSDGYAWEQVLTPLVRNVSKLNGFLYASSSDSSILSSVDGRSWTEVGNGLVYDIESMVASSAQLMLISDRDKIMCSQGIDSLPIFNDLVGNGSSLEQDLTLAGDADLDGLSNGVALFFDASMLNLSNGVINYFPSLSQPSDGESVKLELSLPENIPPYLKLIVEKSEDLDEWQEVATREMSGLWLSSYLVEVGGVEDGRKAVKLTIDAMDLKSGAVFWRSRIVTD